MSRRNQLLEGTPVLREGIGQGRAVESLKEAESFEKKSSPRRKLSPRRKPSLLAEFEPAREVESSKKVEPSGESESSYCAGVLEVESLEPSSEGYRVLERKSFGFVLFLRI